MANTRYIATPHQRQVNVGRNERAYVQVGFDQYNIEDLYRLAFGYIAIRHNDADNLNVLPITRYSKEGKPIMIPMSVGGYEMPYEPIVRVKESWKVLETDIDGLEGTFKESWRKNDLSIHIEGFIIDEEEVSEYPVNLVREFREVFNQGASIEVDEHTVLRDTFGVTHLTIYDVEYPEMNGFPNVVPYKITAKSDFLHEDNFEIEITG